MDFDNDSVMALIIVFLLFVIFYNQCQNRKEYFNKKEVQEDDKEDCIYDKSQVPKINRSDNINIGVHIGGHTSSHSNALVASTFRDQNIIN